MTVEQKDSGDMQVFNMHSHIEAKILFSKKTSTSDMYVVFDHQGKLMSSTYKTIKSDGKIITNAAIQNGKLAVEHNGDKSTLPGDIELSSVLLYFNEPQQLKNIFSERAGKFFDLLKQNDGSYQATLDDGNAKFSYTHGKLAQIEVSKGILGTVVITPVQ